MSEKDPQNILVEEILKDARTRGEREMKKAGTEAQKIIADAKAGARVETGKALEESRKRVEVKRRMILRTVDQEVARKKLAARDEIVRDVLEQAKARLHHLSGESYRQSVTRLALDAIRQMPADAFVLKVCARPGEDLDAEALASEIVKGLRAQGKEYSLSVKLIPDTRGGVVIESADGKLRWDNSFDARLQRLRADLRRVLAPMLFGDT